MVVVEGMLRMPLHSWTDASGWEGVHHLWISELLRWVKPRLPAGYRAYICSAPTVAIGPPPERPDVGVRQWVEQPTPAEPAFASPQAGRGHGRARCGGRRRRARPRHGALRGSAGRLVSAVELVPPRNKDRPVARATYLTRCHPGYLLEGVHLMLVDVPSAAARFFLCRRIAEELHVAQPPCPPPLAVSYRVGGPAAEGGRSAIWRRPLTVGTSLPVMTLAIAGEVAVAVDLEQTYARAAADAYLS